MSRTGGKLPQRNKLFCLDELRLEPLQVFQCLFRPYQQPSTVHFRKVAPHKDQSR